MTTWRSFFVGGPELEAGATSDPFVAILNHPHYTNEKGIGTGIEIGPHLTSPVETDSVGRCVVRVSSYSAREFERVSKTEERTRIGERKRRGNKMSGTLVGELKRWPQLL